MAYPKVVKCPYCGTEVIACDPGEEMDVRAKGCGLKNCPGRGD